MNSARIGLVEVGSRSVRYLVIDVPERLQEFVLVRRDNPEHGIDPRLIGVRDIERLNSVVEKLAVDLLSQSCDMTCMYGTALCRLIEKEFPGLLTDKVRVLSTEEEGRAAWVTGFLCQNEGDDQIPISVIDLGNGSTEIVRGSWDGLKIVDFKAAGFGVGSSRLVDIYKKSEASFLKSLQRELPSFEKSLRKVGIEESNEGVVYVAGGVATKIAWQMVRESDTDLYRPDAVNGARVTVDELIGWFLKNSRDYKLNPRAVERSIDPRRGNEKEALRALSGAPYILGLVNTIYSGKEFRVTGYGVRHGMAFLLKNGLMLR